MKKILFISLLLSATLALGAQKLTMFANTRMSPYVGGYYEWLPPGYDPAKEYDVLIFSHGQGELGSGSATDLPKILVAGVPKFLKNGTVVDSNLVVIMPQYRQCECEGNNIPLIIDYVLARYRAKGGKVFLSGLSLGGDPTWWGAIKSPAKVHAIIPMAGLSPMAQGNTAAIALGKIIADNKIPVLAFHNTKDGTVSSAQTVNSVSSINKNDPAVPPIAIYPVSSSHDVWSYASNPATKVNGKNIYEWIHAVTGGVAPVDPPVVNPPLPVKRLVQTIQFYSDSTFVIILP